MAPPAGVLGDVGVISNGEPQPLHWTSSVFPLLAAAECAALSIRGNIKLSLKEHLEGPSVPVSSNSMV